MISIKSILPEMNRPLPYQGGADLWRDPHIAGEMMKAHLSPDTDAASYKPDRIRAICDSLPARMGLMSGARVVDLGCGPGLYCHRLAEQGIHHRVLKAGGQIVDRQHPVFFFKFAYFTQHRCLQPAEREIPGTIQLCPREGKGIRVPLHGRFLH